MSLSKEILKTIKKEKIEPRPKWEFMLKNYAIWVVGILSLAVGSLASAVVMYMIRHNDWDLAQQLSGSIFGFVLMTLPYFWILLLSLFIAIAYYQIKHTKGGYRHSLYNIIIISFLISILLGAIFYNLGLGERIDYHLTKNLPFYDRMFCKQSIIWHKPERGIIIGEIRSLPVNQQLLVEDLYKRDWWVLIHLLPADDRMAPGHRVKVVGHILSDDQFLANEIRFMPCDCHQDLKQQPCGCEHERKVIELRTIQQRP